MTLVVKTENHEGNLEELLEKVRKHEIDLLEVDLRALSEQIKQALDGETQDYNELSDALVTLSALLAKKAKALLPLDHEEDEEETEEALEKMREDMEKYKQLTLYLSEIEEKSEKSFTRQVVNKIESEVDLKEYMGDVSLDELSRAFAEVLQRFRAEGQDLAFDEEMERQEFTVEQKIEEIRDILKKVKKRTEFMNFFVNMKSKLEIIVTFLAMLELIKQREVKVRQERNFGPILLEKS